MLHYTYNKTSNLVGHGRSIQRFLPHSLALRLTQYLCYVRPVEWSMVGDPKDYQIMLYPTWKDQQMRDSFQKTCYQFDLKVATQTFRHIAEGLIKKNIKTTTPGWIDAVDEMAGHSSAAALYGNDAPRGKTNPEDKERIFFEVASRWQGLIFEYTFSFFFFFSFFLFFFFCFIGISPQTKF